MLIRTMFGVAENDEPRAEQSETASTAKRVLLRRSERSEAMANDKRRKARTGFMGKVKTSLGSQVAEMRGGSR